MLFSELAVYFSRLEETTKRNALVEILAELFGKTPPDEIASTTYLLQGRLAPFFKPVEIGMGEKYVMDAIARAYETDRDEVRKRFDRLGDIGAAAREMAAESQVAPAPEHTPEVREVFERLTGIAGTTGAGSVERKVADVAALLARLDPLSAMYLCRVPVGRLRLGVGDPTILDGYSFAKAGDKSLRKRLERAYNETSDLGLIGQTLWQQGIEAVDALTIRVGNPVRPALAERLPSADAILAKLGRAAVEKKFDGFRCQVHKLGDEVKIYSRNLEDMTGMFPEIAQGALKQVPAHSAIFEGEALAYNPLSDEYLPFQETTKRRRKHNIENAAQELPLRLFAFDLLYADGENITPLPYVERRERLKGLIQPDDTILLSEERIATEPSELLEVFNDAIQGGLEGIMAKKLDAPYQAGGRNFNWVKLKRAQAGELQDTVDCVIIGYIYGRGKRSAFGVGALLVGVYDPDRDVFRSITKIGTGLTDAEWREVRERCEPYISEEKPARVESILQPSVWVEPEVVIEVLADEITRSPVHTAGMNGEKQGYALRFPRLISFRDADKRPEDSTTVGEIVEMYGQQGAKAVPA
ncbi:MAG: ATP-dependent DNA ligase [Chloroflexota bacterium]|nr:ATP-dependent DNA ligase [Chloroflexota bacterium]